MAFNAHKSKCMVLLPSVCRYLARKLGNCVFTVGNRPMEYVDTYLHLGHVISNNLDDENDIIRAQGQFVGQVKNVLCYFRQMDCFVKYRLFRSFCTAFYCAIGNCWILVGCGIKASAESGSYLIMLNALCCRCSVNVCQCLKNFSVNL